MALFSFRTRSPQRDLETDTARFEGLVVHLRKMRKDVEDERRGLRSRYENAETSAAFAQQSFENTSDANLRLKVDDLTASMMRYRDRIDSLEEQMRFIEGAERAASKFFETIADGSPKAR